MQAWNCLFSLALLTTLATIAPAGAAAQSTGTITGTILLDATGDPLHKATVMLVQLRRTTQSDDDGRFSFTQIPPGSYDLVAHTHSLTDERKTVSVTAGGTAVVDFRLKIAAVRQEITVTASGTEETALETFQSVTSVESLELSQKGATSLGDILDGETGVAKRSSGPGSSRPVVRGFDGDRVLIMQDGVRTGTISSQSGDHGEPVDPNSVDKIEVVKGPATLLYGSSAMGGVVNIISSHDQMHQHPHGGLRGYLTGTGGTADSRAGSAGGFEYGAGNWLMWGDGGGQRSGDYASPAGRVSNSQANIKDALGGLGHYGEKFNFTLGYGVSDGDYGIPYNKTEAGAEKVNLKYRKQNLRLNGTAKNLGSYFDQFQLALNYSDWNHIERDAITSETANQFFNKQFIYRGTFEQKQKRNLTGSFGFWGMHRDYKAVGKEAITPPTTQEALAAFALEQLQFKRFRLQFGGRVENNRYSPDGLENRSFTGLSGAAGINVPLWKGGAFVANYSHSYRAPALEELYAYGPHAGNLTWEIGNAKMQRERGDGLDLSLRHQEGKLRAEGNFFYYNLSDYVYLAPTGEIREGLAVANYSQANSRYRGAEGRLDYHVHPSLWLNFGVDAVNAELKASKIPLPRIPPLRGRAGLDWRYKNFSVQPELVLTNRQDRVFSTETETAGFALCNVKATYTVTRQHYLQMFSVNLYNAGDRLYRNHLSFLKDFTPEIGRGLLVSYTIRFF
jgi:iron complex outermembrane recepter protein